MTIEALAALVPPPAAPSEAYKGPWGRIERILRTPLPDDYKAFVARYGVGFLMDYFRISVPRSREQYVCLESQVHEVSAFFRQMYLERRDEPPFPLWPEPGGLLPFGDTFSGDVLFWLTNGEPQDWTVVMWARDGEPEFRAFGASFTGFLAGVATGEMEFDAAPFDLVFEPATPPPPRPEVSFGVTWRLGGFDPVFSGVSRIRLR